MEQEAEDRMIRLQRRDFGIDSVVSGLRNDDVGATVMFVGSVRGNGIKGLEFEFYREMAVQKLREVERDARRRFKIIDLAIIHRTGKLKVGESIVVIAVTAAHRKEAFAACRYCIERVKKIVPIWKHELKC